MTDDRADDDAFTVPDRQKSTRRGLHGLIARDGVTDRTESIRPAPSFAECRAIAKAARAARHGGEAVRAARGAGVIRLFRDRGPLSLLLYVAGRDGFLVQSGEQDVALVRPPLGTRVYRLGHGPRLAVLRFIDERWNLLAMAGPAFAALALAFGVGLAGALLAALLLVLIALLWLVVSLASFIVAEFAGLGRRLLFWRSVPGPELSGPRGDQWVMTFGHIRCDDPRAAQRLIRTAQQDIEMLVAASVARTAAERGARVTAGDTGVVLDVVRGGLTGDALREALERQLNRVDSDGTDDSLVVLAPRDRGPGKPETALDAGGFFLLYLLGCAVAVAVVALFVAGAERDSCGVNCADRPATYATALAWSLQIFLGFVVTDRSATTGTAQVLGYLLRGVFLTGIAVAVVAVIQARTAVRLEHDKRKRQVTMARARKRALLLVASDVEQTAILDAVRARNNPSVGLIATEQEILLDLGRVGRIDLVLGRTGQSDVGVNSSGLVTAALLSHDPVDYVIAVGICYGLRPDPNLYQGADLGMPSYTGWQRLGDVCVSQQIELIDHVVEYRDADGLVQRLVRGDRVTASAGSRLLPTANAAKATWTRAKVWPGQLLSSGTLHENPGRIRELRTRFPDATGGEMEAAGVYAAAARRQIGWIVVKAICDWGYDRQDAPQLQQNREFAAGNAADFVVSMLESGGLDATPFEQY